MTRSRRLRYDELNDQWHRERILVRIVDEPFAEGSKSTCFRMQQLEPGISQSFCAKMYHLENADSERYFDEAMSQMLAQSYAEEMCRLQDKQTVRFLPISILKLRERGKQLVSVQPLLEQAALNVKGLRTRDMQAFAHFSWEASQFQLLIAGAKQIDEGLYFEPVIHSSDGKNFGDTNQGAKGIERFFATHTCSHICQLLSLPAYKNGQLLADISGKQVPVSVDCFRRLPAQGREESLSPLRLPTVNIDKARRSNSPLRWESTEAFEKGLRKAMSNLDFDVEPEDKFHSQAGTKNRGAGNSRKLMSSFDDAQDVDRSLLVGSTELAGSMPLKAKEAKQSVRLGSMNPYRANERDGLLHGHDAKLHRGQYMKTEFSYSESDLFRYTNLAPPCVYFS